jgi:hypothetical protein
MKKQYLHLTVFPCDTCSGPVLSGSTAVRENEISKETDIRSVGGPICLSCGHRQDGPTEPERARHLPPLAWEPAPPVKARQLTASSLEVLDHAETALN